MIDLRTIVPGGDRPKGYASWNPRDRTRIHVERILELYEEMRLADALPMGPRQVGYRLKELYRGQYRKDEEKGPGLSFTMVGRHLGRASQSEKVPFDWVADASSVTYDPGGYDDPADYLRSLPEYERDLRQRQPVVVEIVAEAKETLPLIERLARERGVLVYSGSGSSGAGLAVKVALRAVERAVRHGQSTLLLGICDFDLHGIKYILRPHVEHVSAFLYGTDSRSYENGKVAVVACDGQTIETVGNNATVSFQQLALTPEDALELVDTEAEREQVRLYLRSGEDLWTRDLELLKGLRKIETEALDPRELRARVVEAIEGVLDLAALDAVREHATAERAELELSLAELAAGFNGRAR